MVAKHRRSEEESSLASVGASANSDFWSEPTTRAKPRPGGNGNRSSNGYRRPANGSAWAKALAGYSGEDLQAWQDWGPSPTMHPDHPSAPVPRVQLRGDHPSRPMSSPRAPGAHSHRQSRPRWPEAGDYRHEAGLARPGAGAANGRFQNGHSPSRDSLWAAGQVVTAADGQAAQIAQQARDYATSIREAAEREAAAITQQANSRAEAITQDAAGQAQTITEQATGQAEAITQQATSQADSITQQASSQAAAIREAAEREVAELRAKIDSMSGELGRLAAYVTETLGAPAMPTTLPKRQPKAAPPDTGSALPGTLPARPDTRPSGPVSRPARPGTAPRTRTATPDTAPRTRTVTPDTAPRTRPTGPVKPKATPGKPQQPGRQKQAMRVATAATAALFAFAAITGGVELGLHGFKFFVFRQGGTGETQGSQTDQQFLARQANAAHHQSAAPKGRHHKVANHNN